MSDYRPKNMTLPSHWCFFNTPSGAVIERDESGAHHESDQIALTNQLVVGAWVRPDRSWTTQSPFVPAMDGATELDMHLTRLFELLPPGEFIEWADRQSYAADDDGAICDEMTALVEYLAAFAKGGAP